MDMQDRDPVHQVSPAAREKQKAVSSPEEKERTRKKRQVARSQWPQERRMYDDTVVIACLFGHITDTYEEKLRDAIRNRVDSYSMSIRKASSGLMHLVMKMNENVTHMETVAVPDEFFDKTFIRNLMLGTGETRRENSGFTPSTKITPNSASRVLETGVTRIFTHAER